VDDTGVLEFNVIPGGTERGKDLLVDNRGFQYTRKVDKRRANSQVWRCSYRSKSLTCPAQVTETNGTFIPGVNAHCCPPMPGRGKAAEIRTEVKDKRCKRVFDSAPETVEQVLLQQVAPGDLELLPTLPGKLSLARQANRKRQKVRPDNPSDIGFELQRQHIADGFLQADVQLEGSRHTILATATMLQMLQRARKWHVDATFYLVKAPFMQLFAVHVFVKHGTTRKQVPVAFAIMSGHRAADYMAILRKLLDLLPETACVQTVTADFEGTLWQAVRTVLPSIQLHGCLFLYTQVHLFNAN